MKEYLSYHAQEQKYKIGLGGDDKKLLLHLEEWIEDEYAALDA